MTAPLFPRLQALISDLPYESLDHDPGEEAHAAVETAELAQAEPTGCVMIPDGLA